MGIVTKSEVSVEILTIETKALGDRSYVITDGLVAAVVDPQRDIDRVLSLVTERGLKITHVFETHLHNDYVTGGYELARVTGAAYVLSGAEVVSFEFTPAHDGQRFEVGAFVIQALHTPGHTPHHMSYVAESNGKPIALFSGGSMLFGAVGRTDLIGATETEPLTRAQFHSVRRLAEQLPDDVGVHPTHGFGSFCSSTESSDVDHSTVGAERRTNPALRKDDEDSFVEELMGGLTAHPRYYVHMAPINRNGPAPIDLSPPEVVDPVELRRRIHVGEWVVDLRSRKAFAHSHLAGTLNFEVGDQFATYLGWTIPWTTPITLVGDSFEEVSEAQRQMARIGIDRPAGAAAGGVESWGAGGDIRSYRIADFADLARASEASDVVVLDVRRQDEWDDGHIDGALHIPLDELLTRLDEVPDEQIWTHCGSGYRSAVAASMLARAGYSTVLIDDTWPPEPHIKSVLVSR